MSLLDDVSVVVTPNGYKAGTLYGVLPTATEGSEIVTNSDMESGFTGGVANNYTVSAGTPSQETSIYVSANNSQKISTSSSTAIFTHNNITVVSGTRFKASCFVRSDVSQSVKFSDYNGSGEQITQTIPANTWVNLIFYITKGNTTFIPRVQTLTNQTGYLLIDNVSVKEWTASDMDVTRATAGTRVDENGLVNYAEVLGSELVTNGDFATDSDWVKDSGWTIANGKATNDGSSGQIYQELSLEIGKKYAVRVVIDASADAGLSNTAFQIRYNSNAGSITQLLSTSGQIVANTINDLYLYFTATETNSLLRVYSADNVSFYNPTVKEVDLNNVPRIDYTDGGCPHILAEPQRTNLFPYSEDFSQSSWFTSGVTLESGQISPRGDTSAFKLSFAGANDYIQDDMVGLDISKEYTISFYAKVDSGTTTIDTGNINAGSFEVLTVTDEWQRFQVTQTPSATTRYPRPIQSNGSDTIYLWGCQFEQGSYATSYIPTSAGAITRNQDQFSRSGIGSLINSTEGVLFVEMAALSDNVEGGRISVSDGTTNQYFSLDYRSISNTLRLVYAVGGVNLILSNISTGFSNSNLNKIAYRYKSGQHALYVNGILKFTSTETSTYAANTLNQIDFSLPSNTSIFNGKVKQLQVYKTALTDAQLTALTS